jgi:M3 family oligoendopeptidase
MPATIDHATAPPFASIDAPIPTYDDVAERYRTIHQRFDGATDAAGRRAAIEAWDVLRRGFDAAEALAHLRFSQDTSNEAHKRARDEVDALRPKLTDLATKLQSKLCASEHRPEIEAAFGAHALALWQKEIDAFDPAIEDDLVQESKLGAEYTELLASAELSFRGETLNLSGIGRYTTDADRETRHEAQRVRWAFFEQHAERLDDIFSKLTALRDGMARTMGLGGFTELGYRRMQRMDYTQADVEAFRREVREQLVPLATEIRARQARRLGVDELMYWDSPVHDPAGNPKPKGDHDALLRAARTMFDRMHPALGAFFRMMDEQGYLDLKTRDKKAGGGFCTAFPTIGLPFIFANFNGTKGDVEVFTHEVGHAFQCWRSRDKPLTDYLWPTLESCEIHSMGLEFLTWPHMELFFGDDAERFRRLHLTESLLFLPYGVAVDHFQHEVYARPGATAAERHGMWKEMERLYLPTRKAGDLGFVAKGGQWQHQRHIYRSPFYYIDYTLALTCALQLWTRAEADPQATLDAYVALCDRGGEAPFRALAESAGLRSPFEPGCLTEVVARARAALGL